MFTASYSYNLKHCKTKQIFGGDYEHFYRKISFTYILAHKLGRFLQAFTLYLTKKIRFVFHSKYYINKHALLV